MSNKISETAPFRIYLWRTDNDTFAENTSYTSCGDTSCKYAATTYLGKSGACNKTITLYYRSRSSSVYAFDLYYNEDTLNANYSSTNTYCKWDGSWQSIVGSDVIDCYHRITKGKETCSSTTEYYQESGGSAGGSFKHCIAFSWEGSCS